MKELWFRVLVGWYRLTGSSAVQAEWRARRALGKPAEAADAIKAGAARTADRRYTCVCGQLLVAEDRVCHACGRRQLLPFWLRRVLRVFGLVVPSALPGSLLAGLSMIVGYAIQIRYGSGGVFSPTPSMLETYELGSAVPPLVLGSQPWRAFTYTMLHGGIWHIAFNGIALMQVGPLVEQAFGTARFLFAWVVGGMLAAIVPALMGVDASIIGASGSVFALIGMALIWGHRAGTAHGRMVREVMIRWTIYSTVFGLMIGGVAHHAHFAGLGAGVLFGWVLPPAGQSPTRRRITPALGAVAVGLALASLVMAGRWIAADRPPPVEFGAGDRAALLQLRIEREGLASVFGAEAIAVLEDARRVRKDGRPEGDVVALMARVQAVMAEMEPVERWLFYQRFERALYPEGRPPEVP
ncbi:MAG: rhomboid family intramembrane serine protease [bacterium]